MKSKILAIFLVALMLAFAVPTRQVWAHDGETGETHEQEDEARHNERIDALKARLQARESKLQEMQAKRCETLQAKLEFHRDRAAVIREHRAERYQNIADRLNKLADKMDTNGLDTIDLRAKIAELQTLVNTYAASFAKYEADLAAAIATSCDENGELVKDHIKAAREALVELRSNATSIHTFFQEDIKPLLMQIKETIKAAREAKQVETQTDTDNVNEEIQ